jgi:hypothetical protein
MSLWCNLIRRLWASTRIRILSSGRAMEARPVAWTATVNVMSDNPQAQLFSNGPILPAFATDPRGPSGDSARGLPRRDVRLVMKAAWEEVLAIS